MMKSRLSGVLLVLLMGFFALTGGGIVRAEGASETVDTVKERSEASKALKGYLDADPELLALMEKSIQLAAKVNPDMDTNPVRSIEELYDLIDWNVKAMPWNVLTKEELPSVFDSIDQSIDYFWFLVDQPLDELVGKGYYYPTLQYHEPVSSWLRFYSDEWGAFLSTEESWNDEYYEAIRNDPQMNMKEEWYGDENIWRTFNEWFSRTLISPDVRPVGDSAVVSPADSTPQGVWEIDQKGDIIQKEGVQIKSAIFTSVAQLIGPDSAYRDAFRGGTLTHTFLNVNDYHRYHFPVDGTILEVRKIKAANGAGGITVWDPLSKRYILEDTIPGWQMIETRDCVIIDTHDFGLAAILPIGMSQICSCNWEDTVQVGAEVKKGDPMGYFLFGGSDIVMVFQDGISVDMLCSEDGEGGYEHILMGEPYIELVNEAEKALSDAAFYVLTHGGCSMKFQKKLFPAGRTQEEMNRNQKGKGQQFLFIL